MKFINLRTKNRTLQNAHDKIARTKFGKAVGMVDESEKLAIARNAIPVKIKYDWSDRAGLILGLIAAVYLTWNMLTTALIAVYGTWIGYTVYVVFMLTTWATMYMTVRAGFALNRYDKTDRKVSPSRFLPWLTVTIVKIVGVYLLHVIIADYGNYSWGGLLRWEEISTILIIVGSYLITMIIAENSRMNRVPSGFVRKPGKRRLK